MQCSTLLIEQIGGDGFGAGLRQCLVDFGRELINSGQFGPFRFDDSVAFQGTQNPSGCSGAAVAMDVHTVRLNTTNDDLFDNIRRAFRPQSKEHAPDVGVNQGEFSTWLKMGSYGLQCERALDTHGGNGGPSGRCEQCSSCPTHDELALTRAASAMPDKTR